MMNQRRTNGFFYKRRWLIPIYAVVLINMIYAITIKSIIYNTPIEDVEVNHFLDGPSFFLFSILPFNESYYAKLLSAYSDPAPALLVVHCHAFILLTSAVLLTTMLLKIKDLIKYIIAARNRALKDLQWLHYLNATRMSVMALIPLGMVVAGTSLTTVQNPDRFLDGAFFSAVCTPLLVYWGMCAILLFFVNRNEATKPQD